MYRGARRWGWAVEGSPADCVRIALSELCPHRPDLVVGTRALTMSGPRAHSSARYLDRHLLLSAARRRDCSEEGGEHERPEAQRPPPAGRI